MAYSKTTKKPFHETVAEKLIDQLEKGTAPWQKPWEGGGFMPENPTTGKRYRGINAVHLMSQGRDDNRWMTYKQAKSLGAQVRAGEKGTAVQYWKFREERDKLDENGRPILDQKGKKVKVSVQLERPKVFMATVFNAEQIDGLPPLQKGKSYDWEPSERAEKILIASGANINIKKQDRAYYSPSSDSIHLPEKDQFPTPDNFYATALHELGHWTGHSSRLDRDLSHPFGSVGYAKEELRAEISSMIMGEELGIGHDPEQHAAYVGSWIKVLKDDPMEIFRASADAEKIQTYVLGLEQKYEQEQTRQAPEETLAPDLYQLALGQEHGEKSGWWMVVTHDGKDELSVAFPTQERAEEERKKIITVSSALAQHKAGKLSQEELKTVTEKEIGGELKNLDSWNGQVVVSGIKYEHDTNQKTGELITFVDQIPKEDAEIFGVLTVHDGISVEMFFSEHPTELDANSQAETLKGVLVQSEIYQKRLEQAKEQEVSVIHDQNRTTDDILAAKTQRDNAEASFSQSADKANSLLDQAMKAAEMPTSQRTYIDVPFKEKDQAKDLGARWDRGAGSWYIPDGVDKSKFSKWQVAQHQQKAVADKQYLAVPFEEKSIAKSAGALWDKGAKSWYAGPKADMDVLQKWLPENIQKAEQSPAMSPQEEFADALAQLGFQVTGEHPVMDGSKQRIDVEGDRKGQKSGFYVGYLDGHPAGFAQNNKTGDKIKWKAKGYSLTPEEKARLQAEAAQKLRDRAQQQAALHEQTAQRVSSQIHKQFPATNPTPYMESKQIQPDSQVFTDRDNKTTFIPVIDTEGKQWSTQYIQEDGTKRFAKDSRKEGCFHAIGGLEALSAAPALVIGEGYATAKTVSEELGYSTVAAFDAGNLPAVAKALHEKFPQKPVVIVADDDLSQEQKKGNNPGKDKAREAAQAVGGFFVAPTFAPGEQQSEPKRFTDFNDLACHSKLGRDGVQRQVRAAIDKALDMKREIKQEQLQERTRHQERKPRSVRI